MQMSSIIKEKESLIAEKDNEIEELKSNPCEMQVQEDIDNLANQMHDIRERNERLISLLTNMNEKPRPNVVKGNISTLRSVVAQFINTMTKKLADEHAELMNAINE